MNVQEAIERSKDDSVIYGDTNKVAHYGKDAVLRWVDSVSKLPVPMPYILENVWQPHEPEKCICCDGWKCPRCGRIMK